MKYHFTPVRMAMSQSLLTINAKVGVKKGNPPTPLIEM